MPLAVRRTAAAPPADPGQVHQRRIDLAELDPPPADLDLIVGAALEVQAVGLQPHQIAAAVCAVPAEASGIGSVLLGVLLRVEVAGQSDAADHQFTGLAVAHRLARSVDDGQIPPGQRKPDADRTGAVESGRAGHHGGLGGAVGVPDFAPVDGQPLGEFGWAGLAAEDQQPHLLERLGGPQRSQRRHRRDHGDVAGHQPRPEVHAAAYQ